MNYARQWVGQAWTNALPAIDWKGRTSVIRAFVLFCAATLVVWILPWEQIPVLGSDPAPSPNSSVRAFLSAMIATVGLFTSAFAYQLLVTPAKMHKALEAKFHKLSSEFQNQNRFVRTVFETENTTEEMIRLHAEGKRLYNDSSDLDGWKYRMQDWESKVEDLIEKRLSLGELHNYRNSPHRGGFRLVADAPKDWIDKMDRHLIQYSGALERLNFTIGNVRHTHMRTIFEFGLKNKPNGVESPEGSE